jgi:mycothiol synthase
MVIHIRSFDQSEDDFAALVAINQVLEPEEQLTIPVLRRSDEEFIAQYGLLIRFIAVVEKRIAGSGLFFPDEYDRETLVFSMHIHPDYQESEVPTRIQKHLLSQMCAYKPLRYGSKPREDQTYRVRLLEADGFELKMCYLRSQLDVAEFDIREHEHIFTLVREQGIELVTLVDVMQSDPNWKHNIWRLFAQIEQDIPSPHPVGITPFEEYARYYEGDCFRPDSWSIAVDTNATDEGKYVGMCVVNIIDGRPDTLFAGITGTITGYRRRKIATALKVKNVIYAQNQGYRFIATDNEENNPMYLLNKQLGFQSLPAWLYYEKDAL